MFFYRNQRTPNFPNLPLTTFSLRLLHHHNNNNIDHHTHHPSPRQVTNNLQSRLLLNRQQTLLPVIGYSIDPRSIYPTKSRYRLGTEKKLISLTVDAASSLLHEKTQKEDKKPFQPQPTRLVTTNSSIYRAPIVFHQVKLYDKSHTTRGRCEPAFCSNCCARNQRNFGGKTLLASSRPLVVACYLTTHHREKSDRDESLTCSPTTFTGSITGEFCQEPESEHLFSLSFYLFFFARSSF